MPRATREVSEQTARRILDVATEHFRERGYGATDLVTVARDAGVTRGAIYHHYSDKQALFESVVARLHAQLQERIEGAAAGQNTLWDQLVVGCEAFLDGAIDPAIRQILLVEAPAVLGWETWKSLDEATSFGSLTEILQQLEASGEIRAGSAAATARLLSGAMNEAVLWMASAEDTQQAREYTVEVLMAMLSSIRLSIPAN